MHFVVFWYFITLLYLFFQIISSFFNIGLAKFNFIHFVATMTVPKPDLVTVNIRMRPEEYERMKRIAETLPSGPNANNFVTKATSAVLDMIESESVKLPKFIGVCRYSYRYEEKEITQLK